MNHSNFNAAISFAGEQRAVARSLMRQLVPIGYKIFFDEYHFNESLGKDLSEHFQGIYGNIPIVIILVSKEYVEKSWTKLERRYAVQNFIHNEGRIIQVKIDNIELPGIPKQIQHYNYDGDIHKLASSITSILGIRTPPPLTKDRDTVNEIMKICFRRAIFTSMDNEISSEAMFSSIRMCIKELNQLLPQINNGELSQYVKSILKDLNEVDTFSKDQRYMTMDFTIDDKTLLNSLKLNVIDKLHYLNGRFVAMVDIPDDIGFNYELRHYQFLDDIA